jgi:hypothetical protein
MKQPNIIMMTKSNKAAARSTRLEVINAYKISAEKPEGRRSLGRPKCRRTGNIKTVLEKLGLRE